MCYFRAHSCCATVFPADLICCTTLRGLPRAETESLSVSVLIVDNDGARARESVCECEGKKGSGQELDSLEVSGYATVASAVR